MLRAAASTRSTRRFSDQLAAAVQNGQLAHLDAAASRGQRVGLDEGDRSLEIRCLNQAIATEGGLRAAVAHLLGRNVGLPRSTKLSPSSSNHAFQAAKAAGEALKSLGARLVTK